MCDRTASYRNRFEFASSPRGAGADDAKRACRADVCINRCLGANTGRTGPGRASDPAPGFTDVTCGSTAGRNR